MNLRVNKWERRAWVIPLTCGNIRLKVVVVQVVEYFAVVVDGDVVVEVA